MSKPGLRGNKSFFFASLRPKIPSVGLFLNLWMIWYLKGGLWTSFPKSWVRIIKANSPQEQLGYRFTYIAIFIITDQQMIAFLLSMMCVFSFSVETLRKALRKPHDTVIAYFSSLALWLQHFRFSHCCVPSYFKVFAGLCPQSPALSLPAHLYRRSQLECQSFWKVFTDTCHHQDLCYRPSSCQALSLHFNDHILLLHMYLC